MKIYFNRAGIIPAISGSLLLLNLLVLHLQNKEIIFFGNTEFCRPSSLAEVWAISMLFRRESRKIPDIFIKPRTTKWKMEIGQAYDKIREAMNLAAVQNSAKGITDWQPVCEDPEQRLLQYKRTVTGVFKRTDKSWNTYWRDDAYHSSYDRRIRIWIRSNPRISGAVRAYHQDGRRCNRRNKCTIGSCTLFKMSATQPARILAKTGWQLNSFISKTKMHQLRATLPTTARNAGLILY